MATDDFWRLVEERDGASEARREELERAIWQRWGRTSPVLVCDMCRFSRLTRDHGVLHFLSMIQRMLATCRPAIESHGGRLVKTVADNLFATFPSVQHALDAAVAMAAGVRIEGRGRPDSEQIWLGIGIAHGLVLDLGEELFGDAVNIASKLGEDTARDGDILVTAEAATQAKAPPGFRLEARRTRVSAMEIDHYALVSAWPTAGSDGT